VFRVLVVGKTTKRRADEEFGSIKVVAEPRDGAEAVQCFRIERVEPQPVEEPPPRFFQASIVNLNPRPDVGVVLEDVGNRIDGEIDGPGARPPRIVRASWVAVSLNDLPPAPQSALLNA